MIHRRFALLAVLVPALSAMVAACDITSYECREGAVCEAPHEGESVCGAFCDRLVACGRIDAGDAPVCRDHCRTALEDSPEETEAGCRCVLDEGCGREDRCPSAPLPPEDSDDDDGGSGTSAGGGGATGNGGAAATGGSSASGGSAGTGGAPCTVDCDCPSGQSCVEGYCSEGSAR